MATRGELTINHVAFTLFALVLGIAAWGNWELVVAMLLMVGKAIVISVAAISILILIGLPIYVGIKGRQARKSLRERTEGL